MKARLVVGLAAFAAAAALWGGCGVEPDEDFEARSLEGRWGVSDVRFDGSVLREYRIFIEQEADSVTIWREGEIVSVAEVRGDTLFCTDWGGYGIGRIFIDDSLHMHSETPANEQLSVVLFVRWPWLRPASQDGA